MLDTVKPSPDLTGFSRAEHTINGVRTVVHGIGSGPVLVFLHGTGTFTGFEMARDWAKRHTVIIPYHAGFGDSGDSETKTEDPDLTDEIANADHAEQRDDRELGEESGDGVAHVAHIDGSSHKVQKPRK